MIAAVVDNNVFISALLGGRTTRQILSNWAADKFLIVSSAVLINELEETLTDPKFKTLQNDALANDFIVSIKEKARLVKPRRIIQDCRDPKDNAFLECALEAKADFIVTGDSDLLILNPWRGIGILPPAKFLKYFK